MQAKTGRQINKIVPLPLEGEGEADAVDGLSPQTEVTRAIHVHCTADAFNLKKLANLLRAEFPQGNVHSVTECVHCSINHSEFPSDPAEGFGEMFFFEVRPVLCQTTRVYRTHVAWYVLACEHHKLKQWVQLRIPHTTLGCAQDHAVIFTVP